MISLGRFKISEKENPLINVYKWVKLNDHMWTTEDFQFSESILYNDINVQYHCTIIQWQIHVIIHVSKLIKYTSIIR